MVTSVLKKIQGSGNQTCNPEWIQEYRRIEEPISPFYYLKDPTSHKLLIEVVVSMFCHTHS